MAEKKYAQGLKLLRQPVMPLVSMVQFIFMTGPFATVREVIEELPEPIETDRAVYRRPKALLHEYLDILQQYEPLKNGHGSGMSVVDEGGKPVDAFAAAEAVIAQQILTRELEKINSLLCAPCGCTLCCVGPEREMQQQFFEIPLQDGELDLFVVSRYENGESIKASPYDENDLLLEGRPFHAADRAKLIHWRSGWSLILPKGSACPNLEAVNGRCRVYADRPEVCRRPQIFPYIIEKTPDNHGKKGDILRIRRALLAIVDCPYVLDLKDEIVEYAAACSLQLILKENKG